MRLIIPSRGRADYAPTLSSLPSIVRPLVEVWVPKEEYRLYKKSPIFDSVRIECWPSYVDCIPKKRRYLYEEIDGSYMVIDDDLGLKVWSKEHSNYVAAINKPNLFLRGLEHTYAHFDTSVCVGIANTFMTPMKILKTRSFDFNMTPYNFAGFSSNRPKIDFKTFFFTDVAMPMQLAAAGHKLLTKGMIAYSLRDNKKLQSSGTSTYRDEFTIKYSALSLARQLPGYVFGFSRSDNLAGGWNLKKTYCRPNAAKTAAWLLDFAKEESLKALPSLVELSLKTPMDELLRTYRSNWEKAIKGSGDPLKPSITKGLFK